MTRLSATSAPVEVSNFFSILPRNRFQFHGTRTRTGSDHPSSSKIFGFRIIFHVPERRSSKAIESKMKAIESAPSPLLITSGATERLHAILRLRAWKSVIAFANAVLMILLLPFEVRRSRGSSFSWSLSSAVMSCEETSDNGEEEVSGVRRRVLRLPALVVPWKSDSTGRVEEEVATRRAIAIRRVLDDDDDDRTVRDYYLFGTSRGDTLFTQSWTPVGVEVKALVVLLHGLNEHSGRYSEFAKQINAIGCKVYGMDWIGHGGSDGLHGYVHSLDDAVSDLKAFICKVLMENPGLPCFCFGHSTGAAIILKAVMDPKIENLLKGVILTSPAIRVQPSHPIFRVIAPLISFLLPKYQFNAANRRGIPVSRDEKELVAKYSDPLVYTGAIRVRTGAEILRLSSYLQQNLSKLSIPFIVLHGTADTVTDPKASQKLYVEASSSDKSIKLYEGYLHDLLFETEREIIVEDIIDWLNSRISVYRY